MAALLALVRGRVPLVDAIITSSSAPGVFATVEIHGEHHVDGGIREVLRDEVAAAERDPRVTVIAPDFDVHTTFQVEAPLIALSVDHGWMRAHDVVTGAPADAVATTNDIVRTRLELAAARGELADTAPDPDRADVFEAELAALIERRDPTSLPPPAARVRARPGLPGGAPREY